MEESDMNRIRTAALALVLTVGASGVAVAQTTPERPNRDRAEMGRHRGRGQGMGGLMKGVNLTDAQKTQARQIRDKYQPQFKSLRESMQPAVKDARAARQRGDSAAAKAAWDRTADTRTKMQALRDQQLNELRAILTPAQRTTFDANLAEMKKKREEHGDRRKAHKS
jgi:Spy/CpxP family protein refolding chaperone